ncbi:phytanoyl-CoA dioxygenase family protein [Maribacter sp. 2210JD10-5]|uniref:phytanoyl-CoA dioxygenase family protein n=1 Tax=Maribacter sp. 2210JD10-5 TaxID=3386272 RepID=UPI0039BD0053
MLIEKQIANYHQNGFLILENLLEGWEIEKLKSGLDSFKSFKEEPNVITEENGSIRSIFAPERQVAVFKDLINDARLLKSSEQLIGDDLYLYQYKLNLKEAFVGKYWEWHQDFPYWHFDDGIDKPDMISVMLLLDDVSSYQGPLLLIPNSQKNGIAQFHPKEHLKNGKDSLLSSLTSDLKYTVHNNLVAEQAKANGIVPFEGKAGSVLFFHPNVYHASNMNVSPFERSTAILTYNSMSNAPAKKSNRPDYICYKEVEKLVP